METEHSTLQEREENPSSSFMGSRDGSYWTGQIVSTTGYKETSVSITASHMRFKWKYFYFKVEDEYQQIEDTEKATMEINLI